MYAVNGSKGAVTNKAYLKVQIYDNGYLKLEKL